MTHLTEAQRELVGRLDAYVGQDWSDEPNWTPLGRDEAAAAAQEIEALAARVEELEGALEKMLGAPCSWQSTKGPIPLPTPEAVNAARAALTGKEA